MPVQPQTVASSMPSYPSTPGAEEGAQQETNPIPVSPVSLAATEPRPASPAATGGAIALLELSSPTVTRQPPPTATFSTLQPPKPPTVTAAPTHSVAPLKHSEEAVQEAVRDKLVRYTQAVFDWIKEEPGRAAELIIQAFSRVEVPLGMVDRIATSFATLSGSLSGDSASRVEPVEDILGVDEDFKMVAFRLNPTSSSSHPSRPPPKTEYPSIPSDSDAGSDAPDEDRHHVILGKAQNIPVPTKTGGTTSKTRTGGSTTAGKATGKTSAAASSTAQPQAVPTAAAASSSGTAAPSSGVGGLHAQISWNHAASIMQSSQRFPLPFALSLHTGSKYDDNGHVEMK